MKIVPLSIIAFAGVLLLSGCVRRTIVSRPGWKDPKTGELMGITPANQKTEEDRIVWFWEDEFHNTRDEFKKAESDESASE